MKNFFFLLYAEIVTVLLFVTIYLPSIDDSIKIISTYAQYELDENGIIMYDYNGVQGKVYNPLVVATFGLNYYDEYLKNIDKDYNIKKFINSANWILDNLKNKGEYSILEYKFPWIFYGWIEPPYASALAQSKAMYLLMLAYDVTGDKKYYEGTQKILNSFLVDYDDGGVVSYENNNNSSLFLHLLAKPDTQKTYVLNGHTGSLIFLWKYYEKTKDPTVESIFTKGINYLKENLLLYDTGLWSYYDLMNNLAPTTYHKGQIKQFETLYEITEETILKEYADRFKKYLKYKLLK
ncbi:MAG: D-glucuronyl C5-epimerase family protein [Nitrososphaeraceae archaeon]